MSGVPGGGAGKGEAEGEAEGAGVKNVTVTDLRWDDKRRPAPVARTTRGDYWFKGFRAGRMGLGLRGTLDENHFLAQNRTMAKRRKVGKSSLEAPMNSCLLLCDDVLRSTIRGKHILQGVIGGVQLLQLPAIIGPYVAYIRWSNVYGGQKIKLNFRNEDDDVIFGMEAKSPAKSDPLETHTLIIRIPPFEITTPGRYLFSAEHGGSPFAQTTIVIKGPKVGELP
ncbi:MAG TPA: hypothetical protein VGN72_01155 [Tepidisphaeraceae bacterium]|nr:hypothetical protein [Tepidisphaeraceae bacterium]